MSTEQVTSVDSTDEQVAIDQWRDIANEYFDAYKRLGDGPLVRSVRAFVNDDPEIILAGGDEPKSLNDDTRLYLHAKRSGGRVLIVEDPYKHEDKLYAGDSIAMNRFEELADKPNWEIRKDTYDRLGE